MGTRRHPGAGKRRYDAPVLLLVDLDGVVYRGAEPVPGVAALLAARADRGDDVVYVTNNSLFYRADYVERLAEMGAPVTLDRVVSSPRATALWLAEQVPRLRRMLAVGGAGLIRELADCGFAVVTAADAAATAESTGVDGFEAAGRPDAVVVGLDPEFSYARLAVAADSVRAGARFVATNRDPIYPNERGLRPGAGSMVAAIEVAAGVAPIAIGKPEPLLLLEAARAAGGDPRDAVMIGDGIVTDLAAARAVGARCVLMLTGVTTEAHLAALPPAERPRRSPTTPRSSRPHWTGWPLQPAEAPPRPRPGLSWPPATAPRPAPGCRPPNGRTRTAAGPASPRRRRRRRALAGRSTTARGASARSARPPLVLVGQA